MSLLYLRSPREPWACPVLGVEKRKARIPPSSPPSTPFQRRVFFCVHLVLQQVRVSSPRPAFHAQENPCTYCAEKQPVLPADQTPTISYKSSFLDRQTSLELRSDIPNRPPRKRYTVYNATKRTEKKHNPIQDPLDRGVLRGESKAGVLQSCDENREEKEKERKGKKRKKKKNSNA